MWDLGSWAVPWPVGLAPFAFPLCPFLLTPCSWLLSFISYTYSFKKCTWGRIVGGWVDGIRAVFDFSSISPHLDSKKTTLRGCPTTVLTPAYVILSEAKNLRASGTYTSEILRLAPQNDVVGQPLSHYFCPLCWEGMEFASFCLNLTRWSVSTNW